MKITGFTLDEKKYSAQGAGSGHFYDAAFVLKDSSGSRHPCRVTIKKPEPTDDNRFRTFLLCDHFFVRPWEFVGESPEVALAHAFHGIRTLIHYQHATCEDAEGKAFHIPRGDEIDPDYGDETATWDLADSDDGN